MENIDNKMPQRISQLYTFLNEAKQEIKRLTILKHNLLKDNKKFYTQEEIKDFKIHIQKQDTYYIGDIVKRINRLLRNKEQKLYEYIDEMQKLVSVLQELTNVSQELINMMYILINIIYTGGGDLDD